ncbi:hypothetical protein Pint_15884 [Pistacia integerrima]|uniref:Uncharacterized protein n=1 Tax=Pistacia integerrima TaxID=434235 RepID=A0ACC0ZFU3_9ROSI|nr:hypothetical protein Pint_15884 [Pistacia integerrima]
MATRSNFYKNPSLAYKKDLSLSSVLQNLKAYNIVAGNVPLIEEQPPAEERKTSTKRPRLSKPQSDRNLEIEDNDRPIKEVSSNPSYEELSTDVLGTSSLGMSLVGYGSKWHL